MIVMDEEKNEVIAWRVRPARNFFERLRGLIGAPPLGHEEGLWIPKCNGIHTFGMRFPIDAVFVDCHDKVVRTEACIPPNRFGPVAWDAAAVIELPAGAIAKHHIHPGSVLRLMDVPTGL